MKLSKIEVLKNKIRETDLDLKAIVEEHKKYLPKSEKEIYIFMEALPIETLRESLDKEYSKPRSKICLNDIKHLKGLRKEYDKKEKTLAKLKKDLFIAEIDEVQAKINSVL